MSDILRGGNSVAVRLLPGHGRHSDCRFTVTSSGQHNALWQERALCFSRHSAPLKRPLAGGTGRAGCTAFRMSSIPAPVVATRMVYMGLEHEFRTRWRCVQQLRVGHDSAYASAYGRRANAYLMFEVWGLVAATGSYKPGFSARQRHPRPGTPWHNSLVRTFVTNNETDGRARI